jgi:SAM-dependent methyltransferase
MKHEMKHETYSFVKDTKRDVYWKLRKEEIEFLIDSPTDQIKDEYAEPIKVCLLCKSDKRTMLFKKEGFLFYRCHNCGFVYADPQINEEKLIQGYKKSLSNDVWIDVLLTEVNFEYDTGKYLRGLEKIESLKACGDLLDIGCSIGHFLKLARERGWKTVGLELNKKAVKHAREVWGLTVIEKVLSEAAFPDSSFDSVTLWGVIEHLKNPYEVIKEVYRILKSKGVLLTFCPNVDSLVCRVLHEKASCFDGRNHCGYFSPGTIQYLFEQCGFKVVGILSFQPELDTILNFLNFADPYLQNLDWKNPIKELLGPNLRDQLEKIMLDMKLGYKMMTLAQKV